MEYSINIPDFDDAKEMFLLAKERLLDVNDWNSLFNNTNYSISLTDNKGQKLHRDARVDDLIQISAANDIGNTSETWIRITAIQYDFFPDIRSESISLLLEISFSPSGVGVDPTQQSVETILIKREGFVVTAHCNAGNELPGSNAETPNEKLSKDIELHPVLSMPKAHLQLLLQGLIAKYE